MDGKPNGIAGDPGGGGGGGGKDKKKEDKTPVEAVR